MFKLTIKTDKEVKGLEAFLQQPEDREKTTEFVYVGQGFRSFRSALNFAAVWSADSEHQDVKLNRAEITRTQD